MLKQRVFLSLFFFVFCVNGIFGRGNTQNPPVKPQLPPEQAAESDSHDGGFQAESPAENFASPAAPPEQASPGIAEQVMKALAAGHPEKLGPAVFRNGDWAVSMNGADQEKTWYYYAGGRLLPENLLDKAAEYDPQPFYQYPAALPAWKDPDPEESARYRAQTESHRRNPPKRSHFFYDDLYRAHNRAESYDRIKSLRLFGRPVMVHYSILEELSLVEERILAEAKTNSQVRQWINSIDTLDGWNWRSIADTQTRSFHAYGTALDFLPKSLGGLETYWLWASRRTTEWWAVPYEKRFHPPLEVIRAFEAQGFIWGGKWRFYDTMHFEYRPEIIIFNKLPLSDLR
jgi:hypothetical protein